MVEPRFPQPVLPLAYYAIQLSVVRPGRLTPQEDLRSLWHGVLGEQLKLLNCRMPDPRATPCRRCTEQLRCLYPFLFEGPRPPDAQLMPGMDPIPVPHVLHGDASPPDELFIGQPLDLGLVLIGVANAYVEPIMSALAAAVDVGLGRSRIACEIVQVMQHRHDGRDPVVIAADGLFVGALAPQAPPLPEAPDRVRLHLQTPYKATGTTTADERLDVPKLLMAIVRRVSLLQYFYTSQPLDAPFGALKQATERIPVQQASLRARQGSRYTARRGCRVDTSGLVGTIDLELAAEPELWPYLFLGQWLNVGKNASMGFGRYQLSA